MNYPTEDMKRVNLIICNFLNLLVEFDLASRVEAGEILHELIDLG